jgi:hypothetical protein
VKNRRKVKRREIEKGKKRDKMKILFSKDLADNPQYNLIVEAGTSSEKERQKDR